MQLSHFLLHQRDESGQGFPLSKLAEALVELENLPTGEQVVLERVWGVGDTVCRWDEETEGDDAVFVPVTELLSVIRDDEHWFYDVDVSLPTSKFRFGVFDSSFAFFEGPNQMVQSLLEYFPNVEFVSGPLPF